MLQQQREAAAAAAIQQQNQQAASYSENPNPLRQVTIVNGAPVYTFQNVQYQQPQQAEDPQIMYMYIDDEMERDFPDDRILAPLQIEDDYVPDENAYWQGDTPAVLEPDYSHIVERNFLQYMNNLGREQIDLLNRAAVL